jgi:hypothetical protein
MTRPSPRGLLLALAAALGAVLVPVAPVAVAHDDTGELVLVAVQPTEAPNGVRLVVDLSYDDGHAVYKGALRLRGTSSAGASLLPASFSATDVDGRYVAEVELPPPGVWTLVVSSAAPRAELTTRFDSEDPTYLEASIEPPEPNGWRMRWDWLFIGLAAVAVVGALAWTRSRPDEELAEDDDAARET